MGAKRFRLTKTAKILIMVLIVALVGGGLFAGVKTGIVKTGDETITTNNNKTNNMTSNKNNIDVSDDTINISVDEWIG